MKRHIFTRSLLLLLTAMALGASLAGCGSSKQPAEAPAPAAETVAETEPVYTPAVPDPDAPDKQENVHITADANGRPTKVTVETVLKNPGGDLSPIPDFTTLRDVKNKEGDEEFSDEGQGVLVWENHGEDITYEGLTDQTPPVEVAVSYFLDGEEITPKQLAGKSGHVRIRLDYTNHTSGTVKVKGSEFQVPVPFIAISAVFLPTDTFRNVEITNGRMLSLDDQNVVIGFALPGMTNTLRLTDFEPTEEIEIPEYVEIEADAVDFELSFTATVLSNKLLEDLEEKELDELDDLAEGLDELADAVDGLADGAGEMADGMAEFADALEQYTDGVSAVHDGAKALKKGLKAMDDQSGALLDGAKAIEKGLKQLKDGLDFNLPGADKEETEDIKKALEKLIKDGKKLNKKLEDAGVDQEELTKLWKIVENYEDDIKGLVKQARHDLKDIDLNSLEERINDKARSQAMDALDDALREVDLTDDQKHDIRKAVKKHIDLTGVTDDAHDTIQHARDILKDMPELSLPKIDLNDAEIQDILGDMEKQVKVLSSHAKVFEKLFDQVGDIEKAAKDLVKGVNALADGSKQLRKGVKAFGDGIGQLADGAEELTDGTGELADAGGDLNYGMQEISDAMFEMADGIREFRDEGVSEIRDLAGGDLQRILDTVRALQLTDIGYENFAGIREGSSGEVRFIIETEEISKD